MKKPESAVLVDVSLSKAKIDPYALVELEALAKTAGAASAGELVQSRDKPDIKFYIGKGKVDELKALCTSTNAEIVIFNNDLSPSQIRNLQFELGLKVIDRTGLILGNYSFPTEQSSSMCVPLVREAVSAGLRSAGLPIPAAPSGSRRAASLRPVSSWIRSVRSSTGKMVPSFRRYSFS